MPHIQFTLPDGDGRRVAEALVRQYRQHGHLPNSSTARVGDDGTVFLPVAQATEIEVMAGQNMFQTLVDMVAGYERLQTSDIVGLTFFPGEIPPPA